MKPLQLKEPAPCCGTPTLLWIPEKNEYNCPCGVMRTDIHGRLVKFRTNRKGNVQRYNRSFNR